MYNFLRFLFHLYLYLSIVDVDAWRAGLPAAALATRRYSDSTSFVHVIFCPVIFFIFCKPAAVFKAAAAAAVFVDYRTVTVLHGDRVGDLLAALPCCRLIILIISICYLSLYMLLFCWNGICIILSVSLSRACYNETTIISNDRTNK